MKTISYLTLLLFLLFYSYAQAQMEPLLTPPSGENKKATTAERIGITDVTIHYDRPGVKGREGKIYGTGVVNTGYQDLSQYGTCKAAPWRAGANENTTIEFSTPVKIEGKDLPAGKYGFFIAFGLTECTLIFSKENKSWGSYFYDESMDVLRVKVKPVALDKSVEWLKYDFINETGSSATVALEWEKLMIPFKVEVDLVKTELADFREELKGDKGFSWEAYLQASLFCLQNNTNLEQGLSWINVATQASPNFPTLSTKAMLLEKMGRQTQSDSIMKKALPYATMIELHQYGRRLLTLKKNAEALNVFKMNATKNPNQFTTYMGLARGYSATGDFKKALANVQASLPLAPDPENKKVVEAMIPKLKEGKDIN
jgi:hypothetical protein